MLVISEEQFAHLEVIAEQTYVNRLMGIFKAEYAALLAEADLSDEDLKETISNFKIKANDYHIVEELYVFYCIGLAIEFGQDMFTQSSLAAQKEWLASPYVPSKFKIERMIQSLGSAHFTLED